MRLSFTNFHQFSSKIASFQIRSAPQIHRFSQIFVETCQFSKKECASISQIFTNFRRKLPVFKLGVRLIFTNFHEFSGDSRENISALTEKQVPHSIVGSVDRFSVVHLASSVVPLASVSRAATSPTSTFSFFLSSYLRFFMFSFSEVSSLASTVGGVAYLLLVREM